jgi:hypothetical protein
MKRYETKDGKCAEKFSTALIVPTDGNVSPQGDSPSTIKARMSFSVDIMWPS